MNAVVIPEASASICSRCLGRIEYRECWQAMREFTERRTAESRDECWVLEHPAVYTQGLGGRPENLLEPGKVPIVESDRGGQITYHGPGQLIVYLLLDLARSGLTVRRLVYGIEAGLLSFLAAHGLAGERRTGAPGIYVGGAKIASVGLRIRRGCSYHGLALNVNMDLTPFAGIHPCGYHGLAVTQLRDLGVEMSVEAAAAGLLPALARELGYHDVRQV